MRYYKFFKINLQSIDNKYININGINYYRVRKTINKKTYEAQDPESYKNAWAKLEKLLPKDTLLNSELTIEKHFKNWLEFKKDKVKIRTWQGYEKLIDNHIIPELGDKSLEKLTTEDYERLSQNVLEVIKENYYTNL